MVEACSKILLAAHYLGLEEGFASVRGVAGRMGAGGGGLTVMREVALMPPLSTRPSVRGFTML